MQKLLLVHETVAAPPEGSMLDGDDQAVPAAAGEAALNVTPATMSKSEVALAVKRRSRRNPDSAREAKRFPPSCQYPPRTSGLTDEDFINNFV
jgi:hypothetical protein